MLLSFLSADRQQVHVGSVGPDMIASLPKEAIIQVHTGGGEADVVEVHNNGKLLVSLRMSVPSIEIPFTPDDTGVVTVSINKTEGISAKYQRLPSA